MRKIVNNEIKFDAAKIYAGLDEPERICVLVATELGCNEFDGVILEDVSMGNVYEMSEDFETVVKQWLGFGREIYEFDDLKEFFEWGLTVLNK